MTQKNDLPITPKGYRILVKQIEVKSETASGLIIMSEEERERKQGGENKGIVMAMGELCYKGERFGEPWCKVGDKVYFRSYSGARFRDAEIRNVIDHEDKPYWHIMNDEDILGVINDE